MTKWAAVIGSPIDHSLSPVLHRTAYRLLGVDWEYRRYDVTVQDLGGFVAGLDPDCVGLSVTMPCKRAITQYADTVDSLAKGVGASNTLVMAGGMRACFNTDVHGIVEALRETYGSPLRELAAANERRGARGVILGTGATAASALAALATLGVRRISVVGRNFGGPGSILLAGTRMHIPFEQLWWKQPTAVAQACSEADVVVSTVPGAVTEALAEGLTPSPGGRLLDVDYSRGETALTRAFRAGGAAVASPLAMLVYQGLAQVKLMTGKEAPYAPVHQAVVEAAG